MLVLFIFIGEIITEKSHKAMKKILSVILLTAVLIIVGGQNNQAEASEVYVGSYSDDSAVYRYVVNNW